MSQALFYKKMKKKSVYFQRFITLFLTFSLFLLVSCSGKVKKCVFFEKNSESIRQYAKNFKGDQIYAQVRCKF